MKLQRKIVALLSCFSLIGYVLRMNISIAANFMMPALHLDKIQMGQIFSAFMLGYATFQIPWGVLGDRLGPRRVLTMAAVLWGVTTLLTGLVPGLLVSTAVLSFAGLWVLRFLLGVGEAAAFPLAARAIASWLPSSRHAFSYSIVILGGAFGSAFTAPVVSWLMVTAGWRGSFYVCSALAFLLAFLWNHLSRAESGSSGSRQGDLLTNPAANAASAPLGPLRPPSWWRLLRDRNMLFICISYFLDSYILFLFVFWFYLYLVEERGLSVLRSGFYTSFPFVVAMLFVPAAGYLCDSLSIRVGRGMGGRVVAMTGLTFSAIFLLIGVHLNTTNQAIAGISLSVGFLFSTEPAFWSSSIDVGGTHAGAAGGIMNMAGNLGGVVSTALVPVLVKHFGWPFVFNSAAVLALCGAAMWLFIRIQNSAESTESSGALRHMAEKLRRVRAEIIHQLSHLMRDKYSGCGRKKTERQRIL